MSDVHDDFDPFRRPTGSSERTTATGTDGPDLPDRSDLVEVDITDSRMRANRPAGAAEPADLDEASTEARRSDALAAWYTTATTPDGHLYGGDVEEVEMAADDGLNDTPLPDGGPIQGSASAGEAVPDTQAWYRSAQARPDAPAAEPSLFDRPPTPEQVAYQPPPYPVSADDQPSYGRPSYDPPRPRYEPTPDERPEAYPQQSGYQQPEYQQPEYQQQPEYPQPAADAPRFERPEYEEPIPAGHPDDPFAPSGYATGPTQDPAFETVPLAQGTRPADPGASRRPAGGTRRPPSRRQRQRITFGVIFALVVLLGASAAMVMNGRFDLPFGSGRKAPLPTCPSVAPTIQTFGDTSVHVLNASKINGFALKTTKDLQKLGFKVPTTPGNEPATTKVTGAALVRYGPDGLAAANTIKSVVNGPVQLLQDGRPGTDVDLVLGATFKLKAGVKAVASVTAPSSAATCTAVPSAS
jgi:hypothetical protein